VSTPTPAPTPTSTPTPTTTPTSTPSISGLPDLTRAYIDSLTKSGPAYLAVVNAANVLIRPDLSNQDSAGNVNALARGLLNRKAEVVADLKAAKASLPKVTRTLSLARELQPLPLAAKLASVTDADVGFDLKAFFLEAVNKGPIEGRDADTVRESAAIDPTNWGGHSRATMMWVAWYTGDAALIAEAYDNLHRYLSGGASGFVYHSDQISWGKWTIAPKGTVKAGVNLDGAIHDIYRGGSFPTFGSAGANYTWEASQGNVSAAIAADMAGHPEVWTVGDSAILRSLRWMTSGSPIGPAEGDDRWQPWVTARAYGTTDPARPATPTSPGKGFGYDWLWP
jgi:hypothetical protein